MSIAFYDISELEADTAPAAAPDRRYRIEVVLDSRGRLVSAQADPAVEHLARGLAAGVTR